MAQRRKDSPIVFLLGIHINAVHCERYGFMTLLMRRRSEREKGTGIRFFDCCIHYVGVCVYRGLVSVAFRSKIVVFSPSSLFENCHRLICRTRNQRRHMVERIR